MLCLLLVRDEGQVKGRKFEENFLIKTTLGQNPATFYCSTVSHPERHLLPSPPPCSSSIYFNKCFFSSQNALGSWVEGPFLVLHRVMQKFRKMFRQTLFRIAVTHLRSGG
jgi:hypothetical protein